jgi:hypothetical protein
MKRARRASALIEVLFACTIFLAGLAGLVSALPTAARLITHLRDVTHADRICAAAVEQLVMTWSDDPARVTPTGSITVDDAGRHSSTGRFLVSWRLQADRPIVNNTRIFVDAFWTDSNGGTHRRELTTYVHGVRP